MVEREFDLLEEPWIAVLRADGAGEQVSLCEALERAAEFKRIAGELPTQDIAVLRLLLAVLHTVFSRYDENGEEADIESPGDAARRWKHAWHARRFPMDIIRRYLDGYRDRFYLFDGKRPFYQVMDIGKGTMYTAAKLNGELSESGNKIRLFPQRSGMSKAALGYAEAARWLIYINGFDDTSSKAVGKDLPTPGAGWLGKLGLVMAEGDDLFSTLMLNLVLVKGGNELWGRERPVWERESVRRGERTEIAMPDNLSELYTLQSRRIELHRSGGRVTGYTLLGGDFFSKDNAFNEPMTIWGNNAKNKNAAPLYQPRRHDPSRQLWRDFSALLARDGARRPGIVENLSFLMGKGALETGLIRLRTVCAKYADKDFYIYDVVSDGMAFSSAMLTEKGEGWVTAVMDEISMSRSLVDELAFLAQRIAKAAGDSDGNAARDAARQEAYFALDIPFRTWLEGIDAQNDEKDAAAEKWWQSARGIIRGIGRELMASAGPAALTGRKMKEQFYCAPDAYNYFLYRTSSRQALNTGGKKNGR